MDYVTLGSSNLRISRIGLGMLSVGVNADRPWTLDDESSAPLVRTAIEGGINFFDTADSYNHGQSERLTGRLLRRFARRDEVVIATKVGLDSPASNDANLSAAHIGRAIDGSLRRLGTDYVDLYQLHRFDPHTPLVETIGALNELVNLGKVRWIGASSMHADQFERLMDAAELVGARFVSMQGHYNLIYREEERRMIPLCAGRDVGYTAWSPLARGVLAGNRTDGAVRTTRAETDTFPDGRYEHPSDRAVIDRLAIVAARRGVSSARIALAWLAHHAAVAAPIIGATRADHVTDAIESLRVELSADERSWLEAPYVRHRLHGHH